MSDLEKCNSGVRIEGEMREVERMMWIFVYFLILVEKRDIAASLVDYEYLVYSGLG